jgi:hypothetical protein
VRLPNKLPRANLSSKIAATIASLSDQFQPYKPDRVIQAKASKKE